MSEEKKLGHLERGARAAVIEDLFYDFNQRKSRIFLTNFFRGVFFGVGSVVGATLVVAFVIWLLSLLTDIPGGIGNFVKSIISVVENNR